MIEEQRIKSDERSQIVNSYINNHVIMTAIISGFYVDDITEMNKITPKGIRYDKHSKKLVTSTQFLSEDEDSEDDYRTFSLLASIANSIDEDLQFTYDVPSNHKSNRVPIMDLEVWIEYTHPEYPHGKLMFSHYEKPTASKLSLIHI